MRKEIDEICTIVKNYFASNAPAVLLAKGLKTIELFLDEPASDPEKRQICVYMADGNDTVDSFDDGILIQVFLPGETSAHKWTAALWPLIRKFDPKTVFHTDKSASYIGFFPGESDEGGGGCIIYFEMKFTTRVDSCDIDF
jgi:hypothetical protein